METELQELFLNRSAGLPVPTQIPEPVLRRARRRMAVTASMAVLVVGGLTGGLAVGARMLRTGELLGPADSLTAVIPLGATVEGKGASLETQAGMEAVWVNLADRLVRVNPLTNEIAARYAGPGFIGDLVLASGSLWVADDGALYRRDAKNGDLLAKVELGPDRPAEGSYLQSIAFGEGAIWVATGGSHGASIVRVDPATNEIVHRTKVGSFYSLAAGEGGVWLLGKEGLARIDPRTNQVGKTVPIAGFPRSVAAGEGAVWVVRGEPRLGDPSVLMRIDPKTIKINAEIGFGYAGPVVIGDGAVWVLDLEGWIAKVDPILAKITNRFPVWSGWGPPDLAVGAGSLWLTRHEDQDQATITLERLEAK